MNKFIFSLFPAIFSILFFIHASPVAAACPTAPSSISTGYSCTNSGPAITVNFPSISGASGYILDWWFTDPTKTGYQECQKKISGTSTTISPADNTSAKKMTSTTVECFSTAYSYTYGMAYKAITTACSSGSTAYSNPANSYAPNPQSNLTLTRIFGSNPSVTATLHALSGTTKYLLDWWYTANGAYTECQTQTTNTSFTNTPGGSYTRVAGSGSCFPPDSSSIGMAYRSSSPCTGVYSNPATDFSAATTSPSPSPTLPTSPTPTAPPGTTGVLALQIPGIGLNDNSNPLHPTRQIVLYFYPVSDTSFQHTPYVAKGIVTYNPTTGYFSNASFPLTGLSAGSYLILARTLQGSLVTQIGTGDGTGPITIVTTGGQNYLVDTQNQQDQNADTTVPTLSMGAFADDCNSSGCNFNTVNLLDWNYLTDCFGTKSSSVSCIAHGTFPGTQDTVTDLNDDGQVDGTDYTILLSNFGHFGIGQQSMSRGNPPQ